MRSKFTFAAGQIWKSTHKFFVVLSDARVNTSSYYNSGDGFALSNRGDVFKLNRGNLSLLSQIGRGEERYFFEGTWYILQD